MQNQSENNAPLDRDKWREIIDAWSKSGESQKAYCARLGLSLSTFGYMRGKVFG